MSFVILDLEWNGSYSKKKKRFFNEIIEFGAVKTDDELNIIDTFSMLITPKIGKKINNRIQELTHISNEELETADNSFQQVQRKFSDFLGNSVLLTWGISDIHALMDNFLYYYEDSRPTFIKRYCNMQTYCEYALDMYQKGKQMGLSTCSQLLNIDSNDLTLHRALADAELSLLCLKKLYNKEKIQKYIEDCNDEFYKKISFKTAYLTDISNPLIDKSTMFFQCPQCNERAKRKSKWVVKNRSFRAKFYCNNCQKDFAGRIIYKLRYEGVSVNKKILPVKTEQEGRKEKEQQNNSEE